MVKKPKKLSEAFSMLQLPERLERVFGEALVTDVSVNKKEMRMTVDIELVDAAPESSVDELKELLADALPSVGSVEIRVLPTQNVELSGKKSGHTKEKAPVPEIPAAVAPEYLAQKVKAYVAEISPLCEKMLQGAEFLHGPSSLQITLRNGGAFIFLRNGVVKGVEDMLRERDQIILSLKVSDDKAPEDAHPEPGHTEIRVDRPATVPSQVTAGTVPPSAPEAVNTGHEAVVAMPDNSVKSTPKPVKNEAVKKTGAPKRKNGGPVVKKELKGIVTALSEPLEDGEEILAEGIISELSSRTTKTGLYLFQMDITDKTDSITVKFFQNGGEELFEEKYGKLLVKGNYVRVAGTVRYDDFSKELCLIAREISESRPEEDPRTDAATEKRVELHLHTQMSQMDAMNSVSDYIKRAAEWGMSAVAVTDHGVVQAFPEAMTAAKKHGIKVIYGMEAYLADDIGAIVENPGEKTLDGGFVVVDIETTGLQKESCEIIEIGAVRLENGKITEKFSALINPHVLLPEKIVSLTGITDDMLRDAPDISQVMPEFLDFLRDYPIAAHNAVFDTGFLRPAARRLGYEMDSAVLCTLELSRALFPEMPSHKLSTMANVLGVSLENHHRAVDDALATAEILAKLIDKLKEKGVRSLSEINSVGSGAIDVKKLPLHHAVILAKDNKGLKNLYELVSLSHLEYYSKRPRIPKSLLAKKRGGLIIGTACESGEFYTAVLENKSEEHIKALAEFYDYLEIQSVQNNMYLVREGRAGSEEALKDINRRIVNYGEKFGKPVVATCDVHFINPGDSIFREIIMTGDGYKDAGLQAPLFFRTTEEMLAEFDYLPPEKAMEVVVYNTQKIADMVEVIKPIPDGSFPPHIDGAEDDLRESVTGRTAEVYGESPPEIVSARLKREMDSIIKSGFSVMYSAAQKLVRNSMENGYLVGSRGSVGSSLAATMAGITEVNPLSQHYYCEKCKLSDFDSEAVRQETLKRPGGSGADMPDRACPVCGAPLKKDGHDIPFETFLGFDCDKEPDIDLNFSGEYQARAHAYAEELFGKGYVFKSGTIGTLADKTAYGYVKKYLEEKGLIKRRAEQNRLIAGLTGVKKTTGQHPGGLMIVPRGMDINDFCPVQHPANDQSTDVITTHFDYHSMEGRLLKLDILGHDVPTIIRMLHDYTGIDPLGVDLGDKEIMSLFTSPKALGVTEEEIGVKTGTLGIPEFGTSFVRQMLMDTKPSTFTELVKISGLSHGTNVWFNNAQDLIKNGVATFSEIITSREDIIIYLINKGVSNKEAFNIMEKVRKKDKSPSAEEEKIMAAAGVPEWYIESCRKIEYLFPKGHAVAYVMMAVRIGYYKIHRPQAFYAACFSVKSEDFDYELMCKGKNAAKKEMERIVSLGKEATAKDKNMLTILELVLEMYARGIGFAPVDLYKSASSKFIPTGDGILPPLCTLQGLGESAAAGIVEARRDGEFISVEDFKTRTKVSKNVLELILRNGILKGVPETNQLSLF